MNSRIRVKTFIVCGMALRGFNIVLFTSGIFKLQTGFLKQKKCHRAWKNRVDSHHPVHVHGPIWFWQLTAKALIRLCSLVWAFTVCACTKSTFSVGTSQIYKRRHGIWCYNFFFYCYIHIYLYLYMVHY